jgi:hypothetical protein
LLGWTGYASAWKTIQVDRMEGSEGKGTTGRQKNVNVHTHTHHVRRGQEDGWLLCCRCCCTYVDTWEFGGIHETVLLMTSFHQSTQCKCLWLALKADETKHVAEPVTILELSSSDCKGFGLYTLESHGLREVFHL